MRKLALILTPLLIASCTDREALGPEIGRPLPGLWDGAHGAGNPHFFFLPPLFPQPSFSGAFDPTALPQLSVEICAWAESECGATVVRFTREGDGSERLRIADDQDEGADQGGHYIVNWHTGRDGWDRIG